MTSQRAPAGIYTQHRACLIDWQTTNVQQCQVPFIGPWRRPTRKRFVAGMTLGVGIAADRPTVLKTQPRHDYDTIQCAAARTSARARTHARWYLQNQCQTIAFRSWNNRIGRNSVRECAPLRPFGVDTCSAYRFVQRFRLRRLVSYTCDVGAAWREVDLWKLSAWMLMAPISLVIYEDVLGFAKCVSTGSAVFCHGSQSLPDGRWAVNRLLKAQDKREHGYLCYIDPILLYSIILKRIRKSYEFYLSEMRWRQKFYFSLQRTRFLTTLSPIIIYHLNDIHCS